MVTRWLKQFVLGPVAFAAIVSHVAWASADDQRSSTVGLPARVDQVVLPGSELEVQPLDDWRSPIVLRITGSYRHGTSFRYDMVYYGLEPGEFDLTDYLRRKDGSTIDTLPSIPVEITSVLPPGQIQPNPLVSQPSPSLGGYRSLLLILGIIWMAGLFAILLFGRRRKRAFASSARGQLSLADRLRPIVDAAKAGKITENQQAELERMLLTYWRRRLNLHKERAAEAMAALREHPEAGALIKQLEMWLHRPAAAGHVDVVELLRPYENLPANVVEIGN